MVRVMVVVGSENMELIYNADDLLFFGNYLRKLRNAKGLTTRELAAIVKCTYPLITAFEKGYELPSDDMIRRLAKALRDDIPLSDMVYQMELCAMRAKMAHRLKKLIEDCGDIQAIRTFMNLKPLAM